MQGEGGSEREKKDHQAFFQGGFRIIYTHENRVERDYFKILDLVHFSVLVTLLVGKIPIGNVLFLSPFQDIEL